MDIEAIKKCGVYAQTKHRPALGDCEFQNVDEEVFGLIERYRKALKAVYILADGYGHNRIADICEDALAEQTEERV